ncbi:MAG: hypothetical protein IIC74_08645, partial [Bacteroidetes bacterium]|nr:hypothetical protein [Bacteroidota bacterium]
MPNKDDDQLATDELLQSVLGFSSFASTQGKCVDGNPKGCCVSIEKSNVVDTSAGKKYQQRQVLNRKKKDSK